MTAEIRLATPEDARGVQAIYAPIVRDTAISFELEPPTVEEMRQRIVKTLEHLPWLVCERRGDILGYVYASQHRTRPAYQWSVDVSVYVHPNARRSGVGQGTVSLALCAPCLAGLVSGVCGYYVAEPGQCGAA